MCVRDFNDSGTKLYGFIWYGYMLGRLLDSTKVYAGRLEYNNVNQESQRAFSLSRYEIATMMMLGGIHI